MPSQPVRRSDVFQRLPTLVEIYDDFTQPVVSADLWTPLTADSSSASTLVLTLVSSGSARGIMSITQDATDNDEIYFGTSVLPFLFADQKPLVFEIRMQYAELNTNTNNVMVGFISTKAANTIIDDGGGPVASATMAVIYKLDGATVWRARSQIGAAVGQTDSVSGTTAGGSSYQTLRVECNPYSTTNVEIVYYVDGAQLRTSAGVPIKHDLVYTNAVTMQPFFGCKTGSATAEVLLVDYVYAAQTR